MMNQLILFDYSQLAEEKRLLVQTKTAEIKILIRQTAQGIIEIGQKLIEIKESLPHGLWLPWLQAEFGWSEMTATRFINVANKFKSNNLLDLPIAPSALYLLASPSTNEETKQDAIDIAESGEPVDHKTAKELKDAHDEIIRLNAAIEELKKSDEPMDQDNAKDSETIAAIEQYESNINALNENLSKKDETLKKLKETIKRLTKKYEELQKKSIKSQPLPTKKYRTIVIDPPWPVEKIHREERPNQAEWDYPKMSVEEILALPIETIAEEEGCHIYLCTTHKHLPDAINILRAWGFKYQCILTWIKNVGMTPFSWMYSTEPILFGRKGNLDLTQKGVRLDFEGKVREHSRKPDEFYEIVRKVSPEPRVDFFSRESRPGFDQYGNETEKF